MDKHSNKYTEQTQPLFDFLRREAEYIWSKKQEDTILSVKQSFVDALVLLL